MPQGCMQRITQVDERTCAKFWPALRATLGGGLRRAGPMMLWSAALSLLSLAAAGCATSSPHSAENWSTRHEPLTVAQPTERGEPASRASEPTPRGPISRSDPGAAAADAERELGPEGVAPPAVDRPAIPPPPDLGAVAIVEGLLAALPGERAISPASPLNISVNGISNQSHAQPREFDAFLGCFATLLNRAPTSPAPAIDYRLVGSAYLITAEGFDQWELFLRLTPADASWSLWQSGTPIRVLRHPRPGHQQITLWPLALDAEPGAGENE